MCRAPLLRVLTDTPAGPFAMNGGFTVLFPSAMEVQMSSTRVTAAEAAAALDEQLKTFKGLSGAKFEGL